MAVLMCVVVATTAQAQGSVTAADLSRLDAAMAVVTKQVAGLKDVDPTKARESEATLAALQDDLTYLKVKLRREGTVPAKDAKDVEDRIETLRVKTQVSQVKAQPIMSDDPVARVVRVPVATEMDVRLQTPLSSATAKVEQRFEATTLVDIVMNREIVIPAGTLVRGFVASVRPASRMDRKGSITLSFDEMVINGKRPPLRASVVNAMEGKMDEDTSRIGKGAAVGGILGGIMGGLKGALAGILIGAGGTIAATDGANAELAVGTILRIRLDQPLEITVR
jgi:hypothetical protein